MECLKDRRFAKDAKNILSLPFIWGVAPFLFLMDLATEIYHRLCFPLYGLKYIKRAKYIRIDRQKLSYLTVWQKIGCMYCGYANGLMHYWVIIGAESEKYWCGIQHKKSKNFIAPAHHENFAKYDSQDDFEKKYKN